jgi:hypothetical protein
VMLHQNCFPHTSIVAVTGSLCQTNEGTRVDGYLERLCALICYYIIPVRGQIPPRVSSITTDTFLHVLNLVQQKFTVLEYTLLI